MAAGRNDDQGPLTAIAGYTDRALDLQYDLVAASGNGVQVRCDFNPPLDLSAFDHLRFDWRGDPGSANSLEVALITQTGGQAQTFSRGFHHLTQRGWWGQTVVPFQFLAPWPPGTTLNPAQVIAFFVSVVMDPVADTGGPGHFALDNLGAFNLAGRLVPRVPEPVAPHPTARTRALTWLAGQQQPSGLLRSWEQEPGCVAHTYDQALAPPGLQ